MGLEGNGTHRMYHERAQHYAAAQRLKEDVEHLRIRWRHYNFPVQELLRLLLTRHGLEAATLATDALERQYVSRESKSDVEGPCEGTEQ